ncbi:MFS transporter [Sulfuracidifex tepidarius]|uniref:Sialic acid transporter n=1 Tax=Sulfuracidifex tepidarius TaxID=1294262 RepID=A0A510E1I2_9CREN|nr:MFS transporter [Sulfuracidifex tepidarius]BBG25948.1 Putative sialic acid transporter [Sulfuracidifex tepidarius]
MIKASFAQFLGYLLDAYDFTLITILSTFFAKLFFPPGMTFINVILSYGFTVAFRPLGGIILGDIGDKLGRRTGLVLSMLFISLFIVGTSFIPPFKVIGMASMVLFVLIRIGIGVFTGGEYANGYVFVEEWSKEKGIAGAFVQSGFGFGSLMATLLIVIFSSIHGFYTYTWKYLFYIGGSLAVIAMWIRLGIGETPTFKRIQSDGRQVGGILTAMRQRVILRLLFWFLGMMALALSFFQFVPLILGPEGRIYYVLAMMFTLPSLLVLGKFHSKKLLSMWGVAVAVSSIPLFYAMSSFYAVAIAVGIITQAPWGAMPSLVTSYFKPCIRSTSVGLSVSLGMALGIWYTLAVSLSHMPLWLSSSVFLTVGGLLMTISSLLL